MIEAGPWWREVRLLPETGSTNGDLAALARSGAEPGMALVAWEQTSGRGRLDRGWSSPPGTSVSLSVLLRPAAPPAAWAVLPLVTGLGVLRGLDRQGVEAVLKWPNDVLLTGDDERKACGILAELVVAPGGPVVVAGVGVNVSQTRDELPVPWATSLRLAGARVTREATAVAVLAGLGETYRAWDLQGWDSLGETYRARCVTIGRQVRLDLTGGSSVVGTARGISDDGRLVVRSSGTTAAYAAGDVYHLRPA